jgi:hypothetical protein
MARGKVNTTPSGAKGGKIDGGASQRHIAKWAPILVGFLIAIIGGWGFASILTHQSFTLTIDVQTQQITFSAGVQLPFPVIVGEDGKTYIEGVPVRAWLESQGFTVVWDNIAKEIIATK